MSPEWAVPLPRTAGVPKSQTRCSHPTGVKDLERTLLPALNEPNLVLASPGLRVGWVVSLCLPPHGSPLAFNGTASQYPG